MTTRTVVLMISVGLCTPMAQAGIIATGDVRPADPATWTTSTYAYIGEFEAGSVTVDDDSDLVSANSYLGYYSGSTGVVTVSGVGSTWTNSGYLYVGRYPDGTLDITNGGAVNSTYGRIGDPISGQRLDNTNSVNENMNHAVQGALNSEWS